MPFGPLARVALALTALAAVTAAPAAAAAPRVTPAASARVAEGNAGTAKLNLRVSLNRKATRRVSVRFATVAGTAGIADFVARAGTVRIAKGKRSALIALEVRGDAADEPDERFSVRLSSPKGARLGTRRSGTVTITDDDPAAPAPVPTPPAPVVPVVSVQDLVRAEDPGGTVQVPVTLSTTTTRAVTVAYATSDGTATSTGAAADYTAASGTVTIPAGQASAAIPVSIIDDPRDEDTQSFAVKLSNPDGATLGDADGSVTLLDNDAEPALSIGDTTRTEANGVAPFTISLGVASERTITVRVSTGGGSATGGSSCASPGADYISLANLTVTFSPGETAKTVNVGLCNDSVFEPSKSAELTLSGPVAAVIADGTGILSITDDGDD